MGEVSLKKNELITSLPSREIWLVKFKFSLFFLKPKILKNIETVNDNNDIYTA